MISQTMMPIEWETDHLPIQYSNLNTYEKDKSDNSADNIANAGKFGISPGHHHYEKR